MEEKDIASVTIHYEDGTTEEVKKGIVIEEKSNKDGTISTTFYPVRMAVLDIGNITTTLIQLADNLGIFDNLK